MTRRKQLSNAIQLYTAALEQSPVSVFQAAVYVGSGVIEKIMDDSVVIGGEYYFRFACEFYCD